MPIIKLFTEQQFKEANLQQKLNIQCNFCHKPFETKKKRLLQANRQKSFNAKCEFCSLHCKNQSIGLCKIVSCLQCAKEFMKNASQIKKCPNNFCSRSCAVTYNNTHKTKGIRRSKLEAWIENQLSIIYPTLEIHFNRKDAINSELDIYIPSLKLAFELNGIFHYEPIFGIDTLYKCQNNDQRKFQACIEYGIELCIIDTSKHKNFTEQTCKPFLDIIQNIVNLKLARHDSNVQPRD